MCKAIIDKLVVEYGFELVKKGISYIKNSVNKPKSSLEKYISNSKKRKFFNKVYFSNIDIVYTFKDCKEDENLFSLEAEYTFSGSVEGKSLGYLLLYLSLKENNSDNVTMETIDCHNGNNCVKAVISKYDNGGKLYGDNGAYWRIPFYGGTRRYMDTIKTKLKIRWKRFSPKGEISNFMIDPKNYAEKAKVERINISVVNESNCKISNIKMSEYNRKTRKLFGDNSQYEVYNFGNNKSGSTVLIDNKAINKQEINENKIFVLEFYKQDM